MKGLANVMKGLCYVEDFWLKDTTTIGQFVDTYWQCRSQVFSLRLSGGRFSYLCRSDVPILKILEVKVVVGPKQYGIQKASFHFSL